MKRSAAHRRGDLRRAKSERLAKAKVAKEKREAQRRMEAAAERADQIRRKHPEYCEYCDDACRTGGFCD